MIFLVTFITALVLSMTIIPIMARIAPRVGMIDRPDPRKVHAKAIPRAGGVGIVLGALIPIALWLPLDDLFGMYVFGAVVLLIFGVWDDRRELGHYVKFIGQIIAVVPVVYYGGLQVTHLPFMGLDTLPDYIGKPFTVFALMGMINAINHSDGLDGLAGGISLLSLGCMIYLALSGDGDSVAIIALATIGGVFGFLRYNTHPARVFMGDGGSQFLGFTLGFLAVYLVEHANTALSAALPALILGLPIVDILAVFVQRVYHGMNWFRASKNHIHHRLLQLGFDHYEAVVIIYSAQILLVVGAILFPYESDLLILSAYVVICSSIFVFLIVAEKTGWRAHRSNHVSKLTNVIQAIKLHKLFKSLPIGFVTVVVPVYFIAISILAKTVPRDVSTLSAILGLILFVYIIFRRASRNSIVVQAIVYIAAAFMVYLGSTPIDGGTSLSWVRTAELAYFAVLAFVIGIIIRYGNIAEFKTTPLDYLVIFIVLFAGFLLQKLPDKAFLGPMAVKLVILFYSCEIIFTRTAIKWYVFSVPVFLSLSIIAARAII